MPGPSPHVSAAGTILEESFQDKGASPSLETRKWLVKEINKYSPITKKRVDKFFWTKCQIMAGRPRNSNRRAKRAAERGRGG